MIQPLSDNLESPNSICQLVKDHCSTKLAREPPLIIITYVVVFLPLAILLVYDCTSPQWKTTRTATLRAWSQCLFAVTSLGMLGLYIGLQVHDREYSEMCLAVILFALTAFFLFRAVWVLVQLFYFRAWVSHALNCMHEQGYPMDFPHFPTDHKFCDISNDSSTQCVIDSLIEEMLVSNNVIDLDFWTPAGKCYLNLAALSWRSVPENNPLVVPHAPEECAIRWMIPFLAQYGNEWLRDCRNVDSFAKRGMINAIHDVPGARIIHQAALISTQPIEIEAKHSLSDWKEHLAWDRYWSAVVLSSKGILSTGSSIGSAEPFGVSKKKTGLKYQNYESKIRTITSRLPTDIYEDFPVRDFNLVQSISWSDLENFMSFLHREQFYFNVGPDLVSSSVEEFSDRTGPKGCHLFMSFLRSSVPRIFYFPNFTDLLVESSKSDKREDPPQPHIRTIHSQSGLSSVIPHRNSDETFPMAMYAADIRTESFECNTNNSNDLSISSSTSERVASPEDVIFYQLGFSEEESRANCFRLLLRLEHCTFPLWASGNIWKLSALIDNILAILSGYHSPLEHGAAENLTYHHVISSDNHVYNRSEVIRNHHMAMEIERLSKSNWFRHEEELTKYKRLRFSGCVMETMRETMAAWKKDHIEGSGKDIWSPQIPCKIFSFKASLKLRDAVRLARLNSIKPWWEEKELDCFEKRWALEARVVWECQCHMQYLMNGNGNECDEQGPGALAGIILSLLAFPSLATQLKFALEQADSDATVPKNSNNIYLRLFVEPVAGPQPLAVEIRLWGPFENIEVRVVRSTHPCNHNSIPKFRWQDWRDAFQGRMEGIQNRDGYSTERTIESESITGEVEKVASIDPRRYGLVWKGWPCHNPRMFASRLHLFENESNLRDEERSEVVIDIE